MELGGGTFVAIADDIIGGIKHEAVLPAFLLIEERFRTLHLELNYEKSTLFSNKEEVLDNISFSQSEKLQEVQKITEGIIILGTTVPNSIDFHNRFIQKKINEARTALQTTTMFGKEYQKRRPM